MLKELHLNHKFDTILELIDADILNLNNIQYPSKLSDFHYVIHLAAQPGVRESFENKETYFKQNIEGTRSILKFAAKLNLEKFINFSSSSVYGNQISYPLVEDMIPQPTSPYGESKYEAEILCSQFSESVSFPIYTLRPFSVYGPQLRPKLAISTFSEQIMNAQQICVNGNGEKQRDFTYVSDVVQAVKLCIQMDLGRGNHIFNVGNGNPVSIKDLISKISILVNKKPEIIFKDDFKGDVDKTWASLEKISKTLNYRPQIKIDNGLKMYIKWLQKPDFNQLL